MTDKFAKRESKKEKSRKGNRRIKNGILGKGEEACNLMKL